MCMYGIPHRMCKPALCVFLFLEITIVKHMEDRVCTETQNVTFEVELSHPGVDAVWTLRNHVLKPGPKYKIEAKGKRYTLTVMNTMKDEEGQYMFAAGEKTSSAKLTVSGRLLFCCPFLSILHCLPTAIYSNILSYGLTARANRTTSSILAHSLLSLLLH